ncbi:hypothetical protein TrLO_g9621 [Triparma laevis f. longispina]|uniref:Uncharacterized protein n=1 Tax=Triparma laevis f. longispina TaxID=1714387 RepID=A0A9W7DYJ7_9STRA|nr:hypothetical protein TrLO_g9621 [Triparma laevis f. longispina]
MTYDVLYVYTPAGLFNQADVQKRGGVDGYRLDVSNPFFEFSHSSWNDVGEYVVGEEVKAQAFANVVNMKNDGNRENMPFIWFDLTFDSTWYAQYDFVGTPGVFKPFDYDDLSWEKKGPGNFYLAPENKEVVANSKFVNRPGINTTIGRYDEVGFEEFSGVIGHMGDIVGEEMRQRVAVFGDVWMDENGWIMSRWGGGRGVVNAGCCWNKPLVDFDVREEGSKEYERVIGPAAMWASTNWHFPGEMMMGLAYLTPEQIRGSVVHVVEKRGSDEEDLGSLIDQVELVQKAAILITPHGANEVFDTGAHRGTCKIEILDPTNNNLCYARQSLFCGHQYSGVTNHVELSRENLCHDLIMAGLNECFVREGLEVGWEDMVDKSIK